MKTNNDRGYAFKRAGDKHIFKIFGPLQKVIK